MISQAISRYLDHYAEPIARMIQAEWLSTLDQIYQSVLVLPLFDEALNCLESILPNSTHHTLVIAVVNASEDANRAAIQRTQTFLTQFQPHPQLPFTVVDQPSGNTLLLVDCCTSPRQLPPKQGVGLARKIGGDIALACIAAQTIQTPWIYCSDGDVQLPEDYFATPNFGPDVAVAIYPFRHHPHHPDILEYEISLRYYVLGLAQAGSHYAFQTIGSLLKINAEHYAKVRGFPKRQAAEDFYMLNKLAKTGQVIRLKQPTVVLSSRLSHRVPFGTGAAMVKLSQDPGLHLYHPQIFGELQRWLALDQCLWQGLRPHAFPDVMMSFQAWWQQQHLAPSLLETLLHLKVDQALQQAFQQCQDFPHFQFYLRVWFDAFRTLKFVHYQRDNYWPSLPIPEAITLFKGSNLCNFSQRPPHSLPVSHQELQPSSLKILDIMQELCTLELQLPTYVGPTQSLTP
ncbi:hypothetical protein ON05_013705 [Acaryochloris sp. CCMEE 5410]|nr:hypothetical protein ON05_013705 [Acaryochloris sp. CCMEE 5410]